MSPPVEPTPLTLVLRIHESLERAAEHLRAGNGAKALELIDEVNAGDLLELAEVCEQ